jgi:putative tryptophan/tyrosine transport system substrate-binding protein
VSIMKRRHFISLVGAAAMLSARAIRAAAAPARRSARIGFISGLDQAAAGDFLAGLRYGLAEHGYVEPRTLTIDLLFADYVPERIPALLEELERRRVDVVVTHAGATSSVVRASRTIPAVYELSADPVSLGLATDLAHPLYNATGITLMAFEMNGKRLELLHEIAPQIRRVAILANPLHPGMEFERTYFENTAKQLGIEFSFFRTSNRVELERALATIAEAPPQALVALSDAFVVQNRDYIIGFAMQHHLPVVSGWAVMAESGAVCTYGPRLIESYRRTAYFVDRILNGAKPGELPIEQPTVLELVINLSSAKALGLTIPPAVLVRADRVIE